MNKHLVAIFAVILNNEVIFLDTNLKDLHTKFSNKEKTARNYQWFYREFKKTGYFSLEFGDKIYYFQKVL